jgi:hypothetical protein
VAAKKVEAKEQLTRLLLELLNPKDDKDDDDPKRTP